MLLISHRGNITKKIPEKENTISHINNALNEGYYVEIDVWFKDSKWYLGHDYPNIQVDYSFINNPKFFLHTKNKNALFALHEANYSINAEYFWHENDTYTLTSKNNIWVYVGMPLLPNSICVLPEQSLSGDINLCKGICSDVIYNYKNIL